MTVCRMVVWDALILLEKEANEAISSALVVFSGLKIMVLLSSTLYTTTTSNYSREGKGNGR